MLVILSKIGKLLAKLALALMLMISTIFRIAHDVGMSVTVFY